MKNFIPCCCCCCPQKTLPNSPPGVYVEVDNNTSGVPVHFTIQYTTRQGNTYTLNSPVFSPNNIERLSFPTRATSVLVWIYNDLTTPPSVLIQGKLSRISRICFEVNGTPRTVRCREVTC
ncbi:hypothetical protein [Clostridium botulinum]|uniref:Uncharacterized protein n=1 Tax=Clostridium botulinum TaxID=1491 RepID=A0A9Q1UW63_CLOBO|nr:hypothetical protein [Clostridium botulinum]AEB74973.1 hypothetical protein CbC4_0293 [Clostridium botulinum BKT015925]KEI02256.1 hypothetical protein Y848_07905 [Clostridium botulinum C/D str. Sp77]KEI03641.1 hypothetical protein Z953_04055 [Clostridium botulinum D str. 16868]KLU77061.1 hypothetical protein CBC3_00395 [Clostridium botulinum V891]KOA74178.1 hypothetical protein ADU78_11140 [Clostridium botulinum]